jgi:hypothetical protein
MDSISIEALKENWLRRNIQCIERADRVEAAAKVLELVPIKATIGFSGSVTLDELDVVKQLESRGQTLFNPYKSGLTREQSMEIRRQGASADYFLTSANAIAQSGELVFLSAYGHRIAGIAMAKNVLVVCGVNKIVSDREEALKRAREYATPLNCQRLKWGSPCVTDGICRDTICLFPEYKRMCAQLLIIEAEVAPGRLKVILVDETLGF